MRTALGSGMLSDLCRGSQMLVSTLCLCTRSLLSQWPYVWLVWAPVCPFIFALGCLCLVGCFLAEVDRCHPCLLTEQISYSFVGNVGREDCAYLGRNSDFCDAEYGDIVSCPSPNFLSCYRGQWSRTFICNEMFMCLVSIFGPYKD